MASVSLDALNEATLQLRVAAAGEAHGSGGFPGVYDGTSATAGAAAASLRAHGFAVWARAASPEACASARASVLAARDAALPERLGDVQAPTQRWDVLLEPGGAGHAGAVAELLAGLPPLCAALGLPDPVRVVELAALVSAPGAPMQPIHADAKEPGGTPLVTAFLALQDVALEDGPTFFFPATHTEEFHARYFGGEGGGAAGRKGVHATLPAGAALLMDARLLHRGGANTADTKERALLYATVAGAGDLPAGSTYSLLQRLKPGAALPELRAEALKP